jgi:hypothetical protein
VQKGSDGFSSHIGVYIFLLTNKQSWPL